jgi:hypothetical protein
MANLAGRSKEQKQMKTTHFPYEAFEGSPAWIIVETAIRDLVENKDLIEQTDRRYVVGLIVERLNERGLSAKRGRTRKVGPRPLRRQK